MRAIGFVFLGAFVALSSSCIDPVHSDDVDALGPEAPGVPEGLTHRAGQPCLTCHGGLGPGSPRFSVAGTVYLKRTDTAALQGATVVITDADGDSRSVETNEVGNFRIERDTWNPIFPLRISLSYQGEDATMKTLVNGNGGCNFCHRGDGDSTHSPRVYLRTK